MKKLVLFTICLLAAITVWGGSCSRFEPYPQYRHGEPMWEQMWAVPEVFAYTSKQTHQDRRDILNLWRLLDKDTAPRRSPHHYSGHGGGCFIGSIQ